MTDRQYIAGHFATFAVFIAGLAFGLQPLAFTGLVGIFATLGVKLWSDAK